MNQPKPPAPAPPPPPAWPSPEQWERIDAALFPYMILQRDWVRRSGGHFVHYTTGEGAAGIISSKSVWLRSTTCMNDYSEALHGLDCLRRAWQGDSGRALQAALEKCHAGIAGEAAQEFDKHTGIILAGSFVASFSEHDPNEDRFGRLSMWRAYCNPTGVALVLNSAPFFAKSDALKAYSSPVAYLSDVEFSQLIHRIAANVESDREFLSSLDRVIMRQVLFNMFKFAILCTKHPAFMEEKEWRVVYTPGLLSSSHLTRNVRTVRGVPQTIYDLPLKNIPQEGFGGLEIPELLHKIIIGPTQYSGATANALWFLLQDAGVADPGSRIVISGVRSDVSAPAPPAAPSNAAARCRAACSESLRGALPTRVTRAGRSIVA